MNKIILFLIVILAMFSCNDPERDFPDFDYTTVYFAYQYPVRTLTMGEDIYNTDLDNAHKCKIMATWGGGYANKENVVIDFNVDNTLCTNLKYSDGTDVVPMPDNYYELLSDQIVIPKGSITGGVEVRLTDAYFNDPLSVKRTYVIPVLMSKVVGVDSILSGKAKYATSNRNNIADWDILPKDFILYAVKYINSWDGNYLRRGTDVIEKNGISTTMVRHQKFVENDEVCKLNTISLSALEFPVTYKDNSGNLFTVSLLLNFDAMNNCTISSNTQNVTATGTGKFMKKSELKSWGNKDRDALYLDYSISSATTQYSTKDTLVARDRGVKFEVFSVKN